jgi:hypothetical protein
VAKRKELLIEQATIILMRLIIKATNRTSRIQAKKKIRKVRPKVTVMTKAQTAKPMAIMAKPKVQIAPMTKTMIVTMLAAKMVMQIAVVPVMAIVQIWTVILRAILLQVAVGLLTVNWVN